MPCVFITRPRRLLYFLPEGPPISIGSEDSRCCRFGRQKGTAFRWQENNRIRLMGLGIPDHLCDISVVAGRMSNHVNRPMLNKIRGCVAPFFSAETRKKQVLDQCKSATGRGTPFNIDKTILIFSKKTPTYSLCWASELGQLSRTLFARPPGFIHPASRGVAAHTACFFGSVTGAKWC